MKTLSFLAASMAVALAAAPLTATAKGGGHGGRIGKGPGSMKESADSSSSGKTATIPSNVKQVEHRDEKTTAK